MAAITRQTSMAIPGTAYAAGAFDGKEGSAPAPMPTRGIAIIQNVTGITDIS